ncbi:LPS export ABC transporter periplasmic protein LptC [Tropicimonas sp. TH_r6]|uniref:LPS export ABC transporter periplasmic protein LptC n=1 Tax=Tropicimonas sp. TH_r6 TaxID=3082085 RepID=UPI002952F57B|nr:LPS export ABC transporter periplasmic protein LptC [Tropicimonas sp. TH_r6]MDV7145121.1 LPS export ABC transporter periplasmic protein LptC [Tropicimonas sp. TH_r6]
MIAFARGSSEPMAARDNLHSRVVAWLKILLPLSALAILSSVFLMARQGEISGELPFSKKDLEEMANEQSIDSPVFSSVTDDGKRIVVTAQTATPRTGDYSVVDAVVLHGTLEETDGETIDVRSETGTVFSSDSRTILRGNVRIATSSGYRLVTEELTSYMDRTEMETAGPVSGDGPLGTIEAGRMFVTSEPIGEGPEEKITVVFKDGVKVIYDPGTQ